MYKHILIAVDGSPLALKAARHGLGLARALSAMASAVIVTPTWGAIGLAEIAEGRLEEEYAARSAAFAEECLGQVRTLSRELGLVCETVHREGSRPYEEILAVAAQGACDLIVVGSHGRRGMTGLLLGSEAVKVLTHSKLPVLVYRE